MQNARNKPEMHDRSPGSHTGSRGPEPLELRLAPAVVIVNADDWGRSVDVTDQIYRCVANRALSSVSAMMFMEDSERAALVAREHYVDAGLHLNLTMTFTARRVPWRLFEHQRKVSRFLRSHRYAPVVFNPLLASSFEYVVKAQLEEFERLYGNPPHRLDGHHHMHLCANVLLQGLLPEGTIVRRNFTFDSSEKGTLNRWYRQKQDGVLLKRHRTSDYFFDLLPMDPERLKGIAQLGRQSNVEIESHPSKPEECEFLLSGALASYAENVKIAHGYLLRSPGDAGQAIADVERARPPIELTTAKSEARQGSLPHICVCICTYKRREPLKRLLRDLDVQKTGGLFTYSIVVADNDPEGSAASAVEEVRTSIQTGLKYCAEPNRGIARARNMVIANATGDYLALIDDDEFPVADWLAILYSTLMRYEVDGVLGPVKRHFDHDPPRWLKLSSLYDRRVNPTGMQVQWKEARTGNVLIKRELVKDDPMPFRTEFKAGEDQDFFHRKMEEGRRFVWSSNAIAFEVIPPARWKRMYYVRKALLQGANAALQPDCGPKKFAKSMIAVPLYTLMLPFAFVAGQHHFMTLVVKLCDHAGKLLHLMKIDPIREEYVND